MNRAADIEYRDMETQICKEVAAYYGIKWFGNENKRE